MAVRKTREIIQGLKKKGFIPVQRDHTYLFFHVDGRKSKIHTKISHGAKEYDDMRFSMVARELKLSAQKLAELIDCTLSYEKYLSHLKKENHIVV